MRQIQSVRTLFTKFSVLTWLLIIGIVWLLVASVVWYQVVYTNPKHVFEGMLKNNFATTGYTRETKSNQNGLTANEKAQLQLGQNTSIRTLTTLRQQNDKVVTDAISTPEKEYVRYLTIVTSSKTADGKAMNFKSALNVWASSPSGGSSQSLTQAVLGIFPMSNVPPKDRAELLAFAKKHTVFSVKYDKAKKETINGREVYTYEVQLLPQPYIEMLKKYGQAIGLGSQVANLNPSDYASAQPTSLKVSVDVLSRHLTSVSYVANADRVEKYSAYGIIKKVDLPKKTIPTSELQKRLSAQ